MKNSITVDGITYYREHPDFAKAKDVVEKFDWISRVIRNNVDLAQRLYNEMTEDGLKFGTVEAEGYLRCARYLEYELNDINKTIDEKEKP